MGFVSCVGTCFRCKRMFNFNPNKVPSVRVDGVREPICKNCVDEVNPQRIARGLLPIKYSKDAYEPIDENEVDWEA